MATASIVKQFVALDDALRLRLIERGDLVDTMKLALVAKKHHFQLGPPGIAKSFAIRTLVSHIDGLEPSDYFEILLTRFSNESLVFGPPDLQALKQGRYRIVTATHLPEATIAMVDEIFKANAAILNAMLMLLNERQYRNDGAIHPSPLHSCFAASNELAEGEELDALYDRFHFRVIVKDIQEPGNFIRMLQLANVPSPGKILSWSDIDKAHFEAMQVDVPDEVYEALNTIRQNLKTDGIEPSARRFRECVDILKANAWLDGRDVATIEDTSSLINVLWTSQDEYPRVMRYLNGFANPLDKDVLALTDVIDTLSAELAEVLAGDSPDPGFKARKGIELHGKANRAQGDFKKLQDRMEKSGRTSHKLEELRERLVTLIERLVTDLFGVETEAGGVVNP